MTQASHLEHRIAYLEDCKISATPWEFWEWSYNHETWEQCFKDLSWFSGYQYRRKPRTTSINGHEFPEPMRVAPAEKTQCYLPDYIASSLYAVFIYHGIGFSERLLKRGLVHATKEAAIDHAKAIILGGGGVWEDV